MKTRFRVGPFTFGRSGVRFSPWRRGSGLSIPLFGARGNSFGKVKLGPLSFYFGGKKKRKASKPLLKQPNQKHLKKAYSPWKAYEDKELLRLFRDGARISDLSVQFQRTPGAIRSRINKLMMEE